jgi:cell division protein FtsZ
MVFIAAGMGGGTGTGAAPIIADVARRLGALTVGVVTKPFLFEGNRRRKLAEKGVEVLKQSVDTLIVVPNNRLLQLADEQTSMLDAFRLADQVLFNAVKGISDIITQQGVINVDFADAISVMSDQGMALMGIGTGSGEGRAVKAAQMAISSPLLEDVSVEGAMGILVNVTGGPSLKLYEVNDAIETITKKAHDDANIIFGYVVDPKRDEEVSITVIATGFDVHRSQRKPETNYSSIAAQPLAAPLTPNSSLHVPTFIRKGLSNRETIAPGMSTYPALGTKPPQAPSPAPRVPILAPIDEQEDRESEISDSAKKSDEYDVPAFLRRTNNNQTA